MFRSNATRSLLKRFPKAPVARSSYSAASTKLRNPIPLQQFRNVRPQVQASLGRPTTTFLLFATKSNGPPFDKIDLKAEAKLAGQKIAPHPDLVSLGSSTRHVFEHSQAPPKDESSDEMLGAMKSELKIIKETFSLKDVPRESLYIGAAGVLPYAATSMSTLYLAYDINHAAATGQGYLFSPETARQLLDLVTPIQIGYGAVIISFLGAIHWGMEYAGYGGTHSYRRYMYGVIAPAVAWPTTFMPVEYALITQFVTFNFLYFADARATVRGWFPPWYSIYRFVLTFFVGASIVVSLVGRGQIVQHDHTMRTAADDVKADRDAQWEALEKEEKLKQAALAKQEEEAEDDSEGGEDEKKDDGEEGKEDNESDDDKKDDKDGERE